MSNGKRINDPQMTQISGTVIPSAIVMPAKAGIHFLLEQWIPAYAGMTIKGLVETNPQISQMKTKRICVNLRNLRIILGLAVLFAVFGASAVQAQQSDNPTATPDANGVIYAVVQPGDVLWAIVDRSGISMEEILALNDISIDHLLQPGDLLIIGYVTPEATATLPAPPTSTLPPPTAVPTAASPSGSLCLLAFADSNQNGVYNRGERLQTAVAFTIFNEEQVVGNYITDGISEPYCLAGLAPGEYKITRSIGKDERLTTAGDWTLTINNGDRLELLFGSYTASATATPAAKRPTPPPAAATKTPIAPTPTAVTESPLSGNLLPIIAATAVFIFIAIIGGGTAVWLIKRK